MSQRCTVRDITTISKREVTPQGYLIAPAVIGRTGVQEYTRGELGLDGDQNAVVRLMRVPEEVFRPETIASFENAPITDNHPSEGVNAQNWARLSKGEVRDVAKTEGNLLGANTLVKDGAMVAKVVGGKGALSCGYSFNLDLTPGDGFDGYQRDILGDHVAVVDVPRGGPVCRIGDEEEHHMSMRKLAVDGLPRYELEETAADVIETHIKLVTGDRDKVVADLAAHRTAAKKAFEAKDATITEKDKVIAAKDAEIATLNGKLKQALAIDVDALVAERTQVIADGKTLAPDLALKGSSHEMRKAVVGFATGDAISKIVIEKMLGDAGIEKATEQQIKGAFEVLLVLPRQAQLAAQDAAVNRALGAGSSLAFSGGEVFGDDDVTAESDA